MIRSMMIVTFGIAALLAAAAARAQPPAGYALALVDVDGTKTVLGQLPPTVYAPRLSPDGGRIAFETTAPATPNISSTHAPPKDG